MKTRMTFRLPNNLARELRALPNQTRFVEEALGSALGMECPSCGGSGRVPSGLPEITNFRESALPRLARSQALGLRKLVELSKQMGVDEVVIRPNDAGLAVILRRDGAVVLTGGLPRDGASPLLEVV